MKDTICVIDDEVDFLESVRRGLFTRGFRNICLESDPEKAAALFEQEDHFAVALIDVTMPGMNGLELLGVIKTYSPKTECIMITALDEARLAVEALKKGAYDYLVKPISRDVKAVNLNSSNVIPIPMTSVRRRMYNTTVVIVSMIFLNTFVLSIMLLPEGGGVMDKDPQALNRQGCICDLSG